MNFIDLEEEMSEQEKAIFEIENYTWQSWEHGYPIKMTDKSTDVIIKALQKQIPMKVYERSFGDGTVQLECPSCHCEARIEFLHPCCWRCGQKLDWEEIE